MNSILILSLIFGLSSLCSPIGDSYTISLPTHINLSQSGSFNVGLTNTDISNKETINVKFDDTFILSDAHGKDDIYGTTSNNSIVFNSSNPFEQTVNYQIDNTSVGEWTGNLNVKISYEKESNANTLTTGKNINAILKALKPTTITFSHNDISNNYSYDLSLEQDKSVLLQQNGNEVIISNNINKPIKANENMSELFRNLTVSKINNIDYIDMSYCTNMAKMFQSCSNLTSIDVSSFDTSNVTSMSHMFDLAKNCETIIGLEDFDVSNCTDLSYLLNEDKRLTSIPDLTGWNVTSKCTNIAYMFCSVGYTPGSNGKSVWPESVDLSGWDVSSVKNMSHTFSNSFMLKTLNLDGWDTSNTTNMSSMFEMSDLAETSRLTTIVGLDGFNVEKVTNMTHLFYNCISLTNADFSTWKPKSVTKLDSAFYDDSNLDLTMFENWGNYFDASAINISDCFGGTSGSNNSGTYKPLWSQ